MQNGRGWRAARAEALRRSRTLVVTCAATLTGNSSGGTTRRNRMRSWSTPPEIVNNVAHRLEFDLGDDPHDVLEATSMSAYVGPSGTSISAL